MASWGVISTIKAPTATALAFCAHHLELGAERLYIYLDDENEETFQALRKHPKIKPVLTGADWWARRNGRPDKHQVRQTRNARHACNRRQEVDWLIHIDVDEFLLPARAVGDLLDGVPIASLCARVRPIEALAEDPAHPSAPETCFKAFHLDRDRRQEAARRAFPTFGRYLGGGFLSHVLGKVFFRAGIGMKVKIHNAFLDDEENPGEVELAEIDLAHMHAESWEEWHGRFDYRMRMGSYRSELRAPVGRDAGGLTLHQLFSTILEDGGEAGLRAFYDEVCLATPDLQARLQAEGLLRRHDLALPAKRERQFPGRG